MSQDVINASSFQLFPRNLVRNWCPHSSEILLEELDISEECRLALELWYSSTNRKQNAISLIETFRSRRLANIILQ